MDKHLLDVNDRPTHEQNNLRFSAVSEGTPRFEIRQALVCWNTQRWTWTLNPQKTSLIDLSTLNAHQAKRIWITILFAFCVVTNLSELGLLVRRRTRFDSHWIYVFTHIGLWYKWRQSILFGTVLQIPGSLSADHHVQHSTAVYRGLPTREAYQIRVNDAAILSIGNHYKLPNE